MPGDEIPRLVQELIYAQTFHLLEDPVGRAVVRTLELGIPDAFCTDYLASAVRRHKIARAYEGPYSTPALNQGALILGLDVRGQMVRVPVQYMCAHCLCLAGTGSGKTTLQSFHALQIARFVKGLWLWDCRKQEMGKLGPLLARCGINMVVLPVRAIKFNPLETPIGVNPFDWIPRIADALVSVLDLPPRASKLTQVLLHRLFREAGVLDGGLLHPTLYDLLQASRGDKGNHPARQALVDSLEALVASLGPNVLAYRRGWPIHELAKMHMNIVLGGVAEVAQDLILNTFLLSEFTSRVASGVSNVPLDLFISVDEGQRLITNRGAGVGGLRDLWPLIRGTGIGISMSVPTGNGLMPEALSFTATKFLGRCGSASDYELIGRSMGLSSDQLDYAFHRLVPGRFIAQVGEGNRHPFILQVPAMRFPAAENDSCSSGDSPRAFGLLPCVPA